MNNIHRVNLTGGLIGLLFSTPKRALGRCLQKVSADNEEVVFVLPDNRNLFQLIIEFVPLVLTLGVWCPAPGYLVITRPRS